MATKMDRTREEETQKSRSYVFGGAEAPTLVLSKDFGLRRFAEKARKVRNVLAAYKDQQEKKGALSKGKYLEYLKEKYNGYEIGLGDLQPSQQIEARSTGEYIRKPYNQTTLIELAELNHRLKSCTEVIASNSVRLGMALHPYGFPLLKVSALSEDDVAIMQEQGVKLYRWLDARTHEDDQSFLDLAYQVILSLESAGEAFIEIMEDADGNITQMKFATPAYIWVGKHKDRYIQYFQGKKVYFKKFTDDSIRSAETFEEATEGKPIPPNKQATKLVHLKKPNMLSQTYGVPSWTPTVEGIMGNRAADERDKVFFDNDATPRMAVVVSGGVLTEATLNRLEEYFLQTKGVSNHGRVLVLEVSSANSNSPNWKPPKVEFKPLTVGKVEDAGYLKYREYNNEAIRETFRISEIFLGTSGDVNRAAAFTMREMSVNLVFKVVGESFARLLNKTILRKWMEEEGLTEDTCKVQIGFEVPDTMSQKDHAEIMKMLASAGAYSPNDIRAEEGLDKWPAAWAEIPTALAIVFAQMGLIQTPSAEEVTEGMDLEGDALPNGSSDTDKARMALMLVRNFLEKAMGGHNHSGANTVLSSFINDLNDIGGGSE